MTILSTTKTNFTSGEIDPALAGRIDIQAWQDGAALLRNVIVRSSGGVARRPGTRLVVELPDARRLIAFDVEGTSFILALAPGTMTVVESDSIVESDIPTPWDATMLGELTWTRIDRSLLVCHGDVPPQLVTRTPSQSWTMAPIAFAVAAEDGVTPPILQPCSRFAGPEVALQATDVGVARESSESIPAGSLVRLTASGPVFSAGHTNTIIRLHGREIAIQSVASHSEAFGMVRQPLIDGRATRQWDEQTFSAARGWPVATSQHQDRLVLAGGRSAPDRVVFSRTGRPFDFDPGTGLDDEAFGFSLRGDRQHAIRQLVSGRRLQILTDCGEWVVSGAPLTPTTAQVSQQTHVGSPKDRQIRATGIDGVTHFVGGSLRDLREFLYTDTEQAFQAPDIALLSRHLMVDPVDMEFDPARRLLAIVRADGRMACVSIDRNANIVAWTLQETAGSFRAVVTSGHTLFTLVERSSGTWLEAFDDALRLDGCLVLSADNASVHWNGLEALLGEEVLVIGDGDIVADTVLAAGDILLAEPASELVVGRPFVHRIEALPLAMRSGNGQSADPLYRPVRYSFRVHETTALHVDAGQGSRQLLSRGTSGPPMTGPMTGDVTMRAFGWRRGYAARPWTITQREPEPFALLCATTEMKVSE
ncbi:MAG: hypothetical protein KDF64_10785 [Geminicoccaceae bacterium]|nr:hypothetical protein [Geminicoccaceae bacterium]